MAQARLGEEALEGPSQRSVAPAANVDRHSAHAPATLAARLRLILDHWQVLDRRQREEVASYVARTWQLSAGREWFADAIRTPIDELFVRYYVRKNEPGAQEDLSRLLQNGGARSQ